MSELFNSHRSGRTHRAIERAVDEARRGGYVVFIAGPGDLDRVVALFSEQPGAKHVGGGNVYFGDKGGSVSVLPANQGGRPGYHPSVVELWDHFAAEAWLTQYAPAGVMDWLRGGLS